MVIPLPAYVNTHPAMCIALEQYYMFKLRPELNTIPVAGSGGATIYTKEQLDAQISLRGVKCFLYSLDKSILF